MDEKKIVSMYTNGRYTLRHLADIFDTDHHRIRRILVKNKIAITRRNTLKEFTPEHRRKIGEASKGRPCFWKGKKMPRKTNLKNMATHLKYNVTWEWLDQFNDFEKLKFLNKSITRGRDSAGFTDALYKLFIKKFYYDQQFNMLYSKWCISKDKWIKPSLDHKNPKSNNGSLIDLDNLQFISWLENRAKVNIPQAQWDNIKSRIGEYFE